VFDRNRFFVGPARPRRGLGYAGLCALLFIPVSASVQAQIPGWRLTWNLKGGTGVTYHLHERNSDEGIVLFAPELIRSLGDHWEYTVEGHISRLTDPAGYLAGLLPIGLRYFPWTTSVHPFVSLGAGFCWTDVTNIPELSRRFNFIVNGDLGIRWDESWQVSARFLHVSNGGTVHPNLGLNVLVLLVGWRSR